MQHYKADERFVPVPVSLIEDPTLNAYHIATYIAIRRHADFGKETGSFVSDEKGATMMGMSRRKFIACRSALRAAGWLEWTGRDGRQNRYIVRSKMEPTPGVGVNAAATQPSTPDQTPVLPTGVGTSTPAPGAQVGTSTTAPRAHPPVHDMQTPYAPGAHDLETVTETSVTDHPGSSDELPAGPPYTANALVDIVMELGLRGMRPPNWGKQARCAQRLIDDYGLDSDALVREACRGMRMLFPHALPPAGRRAPFDCFTLERKLPEALAAAIDDKLPSDLAERQGRVDTGPRGGDPVALGSLLKGVLARARSRRTGAPAAVP